MLSNAKPLPDGVEIRRADWPTDAPAIAAIRRAVFIDEQGVPEGMEWEDIDAACVWFVAQTGGAVVGIARLRPEGRIGRMAVRPDWRGCGLGAALLAAAIARARQLGLARVDLHAQVHALGFYARFGFDADGPEFDEAGIPHRHMILNLKEH